MSTKATILAAVVVVASCSGVVVGQTPPSTVVESQHYPLINGGTRSCIVIDQHNADTDTYSLMVAPWAECNTTNTLQFQYVPVDRAILLKSFTQPGYCLSTLQLSNAEKSPVGLARCSKNKKGQQKWTHMGETLQWKNGFNLCLESDSLGHVYQATCQTQPMPMGSTQTYDFLLPADPSNYISLEINTPLTTTTAGPAALVPPTGAQITTGL